MFKKILIANRGEIACRVAKTARRMGIRTVAVYSDADAQAQHVRACDEAIHIGASSPQDSYLCIDRILKAAQSTGTEAIHPGYGFLSENESFALACAQADLTFIGPPPSALVAMGLKAESKRLMEQSGVPLVPGYHGERQELDFLSTQAAHIGYPVLIKASAGGGGKGMRVVHSASEFEAALASCQREAQHSFSNAQVLIERYVQKPRHIEIQIFADTHGNTLHLFERDCSAQRRHQKILEEAPAPGMPPELRERMGQAAIKAAQAVGYVGAGTVEFIFEPSSNAQTNATTALEGRFYFMEMNTRLQVEHPVTEAILGIDLVEWQLRVAAGEPLPLIQAQIQAQGHAIEARVCAENPEAQFLPATGRLNVVHWPEHIAFERPTSLAHALPRVDAAVRQGDEITPFYDSMLAKLIVWGANREQALARLDQALAQTHLVGLHTNVAFLRRVIRSPSFTQADLDTALIDREHQTLFTNTTSTAISWPWQAAAIAAHILRHPRQTPDHDPWSHTHGWRLHGSAFKQIRLQTPNNNDDCTVNIRHSSTQTTLQLEVQQGSTNSTHSLLIWPHAGAPHQYDLSLDGQRQTLTLYATTPEHFTLFTDQHTQDIELITHDHLAENTTPHGNLSAPMPGKITAFMVSVGQTVKAGQALAIMEAMKIEHTIHAPKAGIVTELLYTAGETISEGSALLTLEETPT